MDKSKIIFRHATVNDIDFIVDTIVAAEKSGTDNFGLANLFEVTEAEMRNYIKEMLEEEIDGCELSLSSFIVAEYEGEAVAAFGGWIEGRNEADMPSALLKANLINYYLPKEKVLASMAKTDIVKPLQIDREAGAYQLEYSYTKPEYRGNGIMKTIIEQHISEYQATTSMGGGKLQVHVFENNTSAIKTYSKCGFSISKRFESKDSRVLSYFPSNVELLMEKTV